MKEYRKVIDFFEKRVKFNENKRKCIVVLNILEKKLNVMLMLEVVERF